MRIELSDKRIASLPLPTKGRVDVHDSIVPGLSVRVSAAGSKVFTLRAFYPGSKYSGRRELGRAGDLTVDQARAKARRWLELLGKSEDPAEAERRAAREAELAARRKQQTTFRAVAEDFRRDKLSEERQGHEAGRTLTNNLLPMLGDLLVTEITREDVRAAVQAASGLYQQHAVFTLARRLFNWALDLDYGLEMSPCARLRPKSMIGRRKPRERDLNDDELRAFWAAAARLSPTLCGFYRLLLLTGTRRAEAGEALWQEFNLERREWTIPSNRTKSERLFMVPLSDLAMEVLRAVPRSRWPKGPFVFPGRSGEKSVAGYSRAKRELDALMLEELRAARGPDAQLPDFVVHDLRRTVRTRLSQLRVPFEVRELCLNHVPGGLVKVYDRHDFLDEKREALQAWADALRRIIVAPDNVVRLHAEA
jgi:integrase